MTRARSVLLAAVVVCSAVVGAVGPALAQTTDTGPVQYEFTGSPDTLIVDTSALDGGTEFTVEYTTQGGPSTGTTVLARKTYNTANLDQDQLLFFNDGAYESVTVTVSDYSGGEPTFDSKTGLGSGLNLVRTVVGHTGGDSDLTCDTRDQISTMLSGVENLDCSPQPGTTTVNTTGTDAEQTKINMYTSVQNSVAGAKNFRTSFDNYLSDTKTQARIIGKNAYIKSLNNGSTKAAAKTDAKKAVADYYAAKQRNLLSEWDRQVLLIKNLKGIQTTEAGIDDTYMNVEMEHWDSAFVYDGMRWQIREPQSGTVTLVNDNQAPVQQFTAELNKTGSVDSYTYTTDPTVGMIGNVSYDGPNSDPTAGKSADFKRVTLEPPTSDYSQTDVLKFQPWANLWTDIQTQNNAVQAEMDTLADNTYSAYQTGEINNSDLVDPYVLASQQSAGDDFQGWAATQLTLMGQNSPENFDQIGSFNVTTGSGDQYEGVLFSQENPASGQFEKGMTYDTANIGGTQYVVTSERIVELDGTFTINNITTTSGETTQNVTIQKTTYETTNVTELKQQYEDLAYRRAQIEAREEALKAAGGGGGFLGGSSMNKTAALVIVALVLVLGIINN